MAKATKTIKQPLGYKSAHASWFAATKTLFNQVAAFYFEVIQVPLIFPAKKLSQPWKSSPIRPKTIHVQ